MRLLLLIIFVFTARLVSAQDKTSTYTQTLDLNPEENGMLGRITMVYAFTNCFGEAHMAFGYQNVNFTSVKYKGKVYTADQLGVNLSNETTSFDVTAKYYFGNSYVKTNQLTYILDNYDVGCYGQTNSISIGNRSHTSNLNNLSVKFENATYRISGSLAFKIDNYEKEKSRQRKFFSLLDQAENISNPETQIKKLSKAMAYAKTGGEKRMVDNLRIKAEEKIKRAKEEEKITAQNNNERLSNSEKEAKEEEEEEEEDDDDDSNNYKTTDYSSLNNNTSRTADLSSQKTTAATSLLATSALLASQSSRFGIGGRANMGDELFSYGPEVYFMFDENFGMNIHYAIGDDDTTGVEDTFDAYEIGAGIIFDFASQENPILVADGFGIGLEAQYGQFERNIVGASSAFRTYFEEGNILSVGASIYLGILRVGYMLPVSYERLEDSNFDNDYNPGGSLILSMFFYF